MLYILTTISDRIYEFCNRAAGHFWMLDNLFSLPLYNQLVKAALISGCFLAAWHAHQSEDVLRRNRRILLVTLLASVFVLAANAMIARTMLVPRPFIQSQRAYHLEGNHLVESRQLAYRVPLDSHDQKKYRQLQDGNIAQNDLDAFPSDHAAFYIAIATGILMAAPAIGGVAMGWTLIVLLGSRVIMGQHSPLDITAGAGIGLGILLLFQFVFERWLRPLVEPVVSWTFRHQALATVIVFMALFEAANTLQDVGALIETGRGIIRYFTVG